LYLQGAQLFSVDVTTGSEFAAGIPRVAVELPANALFNTPPVTGYDVSLDGTRFLGVQTRPGSPPRAASEIELTLNWLEELKARAPAK
jgi:hypothetical protein